MKNALIGNLWVWEHAKIQILFIGDVDSDVNSIEKMRLHQPYKLYIYFDYHSYVCELCATHQSGLDRVRISLSFVTKNKCVKCS